MKQLLIGLAGRARTGKTTAANDLAFTHNFQTYALADPLREGLMAIFNLSPSDFENERKEQPIAWLGLSARELMQSMGTEWGRNLVHPDVWLLLAEQNLRFMGQAYDTASGFVISDLRFENEAAFVREKGGIVIHLQREKASNVKAHSSEAGIEVHPSDLLLRNDGTLEELHNSLAKILRAHYAQQAA